MTHDGDVFDGEDPQIDEDIHVQEIRRRIEADQCR
jgi:hypothetical protein